MTTRNLPTQASEPQLPDCFPIMLERIIRQFDPVRIILFGSRARGEARPDSDVDLLVVLPEAPDRRQAAVAIMSSLRDLPVSKDIVVSTLAHLAQYGQVNGLVYKAALGEGQIIYERP